MLALSRKKNEAIIVNNNVEITILEVKGDQVKIGITAPKEVPVYRKEVYLQIQNENAEAKGFMHFVNYVLHGNCKVGNWEISYKDKEFCIFYTR